MDIAQQCSLFRRLYSRVKHNPKTGCWEYAGCRGRGGYGQIRRGGRHGGERLRTHRAAWELANGPISDGLCVLHRCDNPACVYEGHLWLGTVVENNHDRDEKKRTSHAPKTWGEANGMAKLTEMQVRAIRKDPRSQRTIAADYGCTHTTVGNIKLGKAWGWLD